MKKPHRGPGRPPTLKGRTSYLHVRIGEREREALRRICRHLGIDPEAWGSESQAVRWAIEEAELRVAR